jgi:hypothetical protein
MGIETFLIFINALISLNNASEAQNQQPKPLTEQQTIVKPAVPQARGGWDHN